MAPFFLTSFGLGLGVAERIFGGNDKQMEQRSNTLQSVIDDLDKREALGRKKYGTDVDRTDLTHEQWMQHAYEEALDMALYLKRAMETT